MPNPKTNTKPNPNPNQGSIFLRGNCLVASNPKINPNLHQNPNPNPGAVFLGGHLSGYPLHFFLLERSSLYESTKVFLASTK